MSTAIVVGGAGALGRAVVNSLKKNSIKAISVDLVKNNDAELNVTVDPSSPLASQAPDIKSQISSYLGNGGEVTGVISSAGSWAGGSVSDDDILHTLQVMKSTNLDSAVFASHLSSKFLEPKGTLILTGAEAALNATPGMLAYGIVKSSTHFLIQSISQDPSFMEREASALCVLPSVIDTPGNRSAMPTENFENWTKTEDIAELLVDWIKDPSSRPLSGSLLSISTEAGKNATLVRNAQPKWEVVSK